jgi:hypothetical protein
VLVNVTSGRREHPRGVLRVRTTQSSVRRIAVGAVAAEPPV